MKMDTVWQAKVADSAIKSDFLDVAGARVSLAIVWTEMGFGGMGLEAQSQVS